MAETRKSLKCPVFGSYHELNSTVLPSYKDVMCYYNLVKHDIKLRDNGKEPSISVIANVVAEKVEDIWRKASIPTSGRFAITSRIQVYNKSVQSIKKAVKEMITPIKRNLKNFFRKQKIFLI